MAETLRPIVGSWRGNTRYECPVCGWDTLDEGAMADHLDPVKGKHAVWGNPPAALPLTTDERAELEALRAYKAAAEAVQVPPVETPQIETQPTEGTTPAPLPGEAMPAEEQPPAEAGTQGSEE